MLNRIVSVYTPEVLGCDPPSPETAWLDRVLGNAICDVCRCVDRTKYPRQFDIALDGSLEDQDCSVVQAINMHVYRRAIIETLADVMADFAIGNVTMTDDEQDVDFVTCYCKDWIVPRGGLQSQYAMCPKCGAVISNLGNSPTYVLREELIGRQVYQDSLGRLYLTDEAEEILDLDRWDGIDLEPIPIRDEPADGKTLPGRPR